MKKIILFLLMLFLYSPVVYANQPNILYYEKDSEIIAIGLVGCHIEELKREFPFRAIYTSVGSEDKIIIMCWKPNSKNQTIDFVNIYQEKNKVIKEYYYIESSKFKKIGNKE